MSVVDLGYQPRPQFVPFHQRAERWSVIVAHRRAGKSVACILDLIDAALRCERKSARFAYIAPLLKQAKTVAWSYLKEYGLKVPGATANETELRVDFPGGAQVRLYGADNPDGMRGVYLDGVVLDEAADMDPRIFPEILRPALSDRLGWCVWIGTPKGHNDFFDLWERAKTDSVYFTLMLKANETGLISEAELKDARKMMTPAQFEQEYLCSFQAAVIGAYYGQALESADKEGRVIPHLYDPALPVSTAWDLGVGDDTAIWFYQTAGMDIRLVDYYAANGYGLDHYARILDERRGPDGKPYRYGKHLLPHDVEIRVLTGGEIARTRRQTLEGLGVPVTVVPKWGLEEGINAVRRILPRCWFDSEKCAEGVKSLRQYRREWDDTRKVFYERPLHDWTSHAADAFRYLAIGVSEPTSAAKAMRVAKPSTKWVV